MRSFLYVCKSLFSSLSILLVLSPSDAFIYYFAAVDIPGVGEPMLASFLSENDTLNTHDRWYVSGRGGETSYTERRGSDGCRSARLIN